MINPLSRVSTMALAAMFMISCAVHTNEAPISDPIILKAREVSLYTSRTDWAVVNRRYLALTKGKHSAAEMRSGLEYLINSLGDKHGSFRSPTDYSIIASYSGPIDGSDNRNPDFVNRVINDTTARFTYRSIDDVGYLRVVGIGPGVEVKSDADRLRTGLKDLADRGVKKWIVDLRFNGGGNMNPMIAGLAPMFGDGFIGGSVDAHGNLLRSYTIDQGKFYDSGRLVCEMNETPLIDSNQKIAVLISRYTISSGEMVAVAFKGRKNTLFIGESSAGYTTGNGYELVREDLLMNISQSIFVDRNMRSYNRNVDVDIPMAFEPTDKLADDSQIVEAIRWLNE